MFSAHGAGLAVPGDRDRPRRPHGGTGGCHDNAVAESFFATLKDEMYCCRPSATREGAGFAVTGSIESCCNRRRPHSTVGYKVPADVMYGSFGRSEGALSEPREVLRVA